MSLHKDWSNKTAWEKVWDENTREKTVEESVLVWDQKAEKLNEGVRKEESVRRRREILDWMKELGVTLNESLILDIGAGPGGFTIPMAKEAKKVIAVEPSTKMASYLKENLDVDQITNVEVIEEGWQQLDTSEWKEKFDLVFASLSPGLYNWDMVQKAIACSKKYVYISSFAGKREHKPVRDVWSHVTKEEYPAFDLHILFLINLLYLHELSFELAIWEEKSKKTIPPSEAVEEIVRLLQQNQIGVNESSKKMVENYVETHTQEGKFVFETNARFGRVLITL